MKILVFAHRLELGGTQTNAIDLATTLRDEHGFDVLFHATPGPMEATLRDRGLALLPAPDARLHPSPARIRTLRDIVRRERPDIIHAWDWWQGLEAYYGVHLPMRVPLVISDMMMTLTRLLPRQIPTTFGFASLQQQAENEGWRRASLLPPPVDMVADAPGVVDRAAARASFGIADGEIALVTVSRLSHTLKADSLARSVEAVGRLGLGLPLKLVIVGEGSAREMLEEMAEMVNGRLGRAAVVLAGAMRDPRPAYAAADIVIGMGGSALRGLAFERPVIVTGATGFARVFEPGTADWFQRAGMYGIGGPGDAGALETAIARLAADTALRDELGPFGRDFVSRHHALDMLGARLADLCHATVRGKVPPSLPDAARSTVIYLRERRFRTASRDRSTNRSA